MNFDEIKQAHEQEDYFAESCRGDDAYLYEHRAWLIAEVERLREEVDWLERYQHHAPTSRLPGVDG